MKLLQINAVYKTLSTGRNVWEINRYLTEKGHTCVTAFSSGELQEPTQDIRIGNAWDAKWHALLSRLTGLQGYYSRKATGKLLKYMDEYQPDLVVLNNLHANYIHLPKLLNYLSRKHIPTVVVLHDCWFFTGKCCHYTSAGCYRWQEACGNCPAKKKYNTSWFFDWSSKMLKDKKAGFQAIERLGVVAVSDWLFGEAKKAPVFDKATELQRIYNWIDIQKFTPGNAGALRRQMQLEEKKVILCVAGAWDKNKGLFTALEIADKLTEQESMILVGNIPGGVQLPDSVIHIPRTDSIEQLVDLYRMADILLQPSLEETFGKVSAEALACGTPVACFNSTANPELVGPGCGIVVSPGQTEEMLCGIRQILAEDKSVYSAVCAKFASEHFEMEKNISQYEALFTRLLVK